MFVAYARSLAGGEKELGVLPPLRSGEAEVAGFVIEGAGMGRREKVVDGRGAPHFLVEGKAIEDLLLRVEGREHLRFERLLLGAERFGMVGCVRDEAGGDQMADSGVIEGSLLPTLPYRHLASESAGVVVGVAAFVGVGEDDADAVEAARDLLSNEGQMAGGLLIGDREHVALRFRDAGQGDRPQHFLPAMRGVVLAR